MLLRISTRASRTSSQRSQQCWHTISTVVCPEESQISAYIDFVVFVWIQNQTWIASFGLDPGTKILLQVLLREEELVAFIAAVVTTESCTYRESTAFEMPGHKSLHGHLHLRKRLILDWQDFEWIFMLFEPRPQNRLMLSFGHYAWNSRYSSGESKAPK